MSGLAPNLPCRKARVPSVGREYIHDNSPSANIFFARSFSFRVKEGYAASASTVMLVSATGCTCQDSSEPSSSGLVA